MTPAASYHDQFSQETLDEIFPPDRADLFFEALFGDATEGAYDISLAYCGASGNTLSFEFHLKQRPGKCLACNLTYGLPEVFMRHPIIDVAGVIEKIDACMKNGQRCGPWTLGRTREVSRTLHVLPLTISLTAAESS